MIPLFPGFKKLELTDKNDVEQITSKFDPYSDFNFVSLWSWDVDESTQITNINGNLGVKFLDYMDGSQFWSFIGVNKTLETAEILLNTSPVLKLIPEVSAGKLEKYNSLSVTEDRDNFDYVCSVAELTELKGSKYMSKRLYINQFRRLYGEEVNVSEIDFTDIDNKQQILNTFYNWENIRKKDRTDTERELLAIERLFLGIKIFNLTGVGLWRKNNLIAFSIGEEINEKYVMLHFEKADTSFRGIYEYLKLCEAKTYSEAGQTLINLEQDLGIMGLRTAKESYRPVNYLKKYTVIKASGRE